MSRSLKYPARTFGRNQGGAPPRTPRGLPPLDPAQELRPWTREVDAARGAGGINEPGLSRSRRIGSIAHMDQFISKHADKIVGTLGCFDRVIFRGYLPIWSGYDMFDFLRKRGVKPGELKDFLLKQGARLKAHAVDQAAKAGRPFQYLTDHVRKDDLARKLAERDGITEGLVCVLSVLEPCRTFSLAFNDKAGVINPARRKCLFFYYYYFLDPHLGLIHVKLQSWFPFRIQVYLNGHEWLARKLERHGVKYMKVDNAFVDLADPDRAQTLSDRFVDVDWVAVLSRYARRVNPLLAGVLRPFQYYWVTAQAEYSTDLLFRRRAELQELAQKLLQYSTTYFGARDLMSFLGRQFTGQFQGELTTERMDHPVTSRLPGRRVKHRMKANWIKMYDKAGSVLRIETVINEPEEFRVRRRVKRQGRWTIAWVPLRNGVAYLFRYKEVSAQSNARYLDALAQVDDPTPAVRELDALTSNAPTPDGRTVKPFNPLSRDDRMLFEVLLSGEHVLRGFTNRELRHGLAATTFPLATDPARQSGQLTRLLRRLHAHGLVAKIPRSRRWRVSLPGRRPMAAAIKLREVAFPSLFAAAA